MGSGSSRTRHIVVVPEVTYQEPRDGEVRQAGWAYIERDGIVVRKVPSCERCAVTLDVVWVPALMEGSCQGCEVTLSGLVD